MKTLTINIPDTIDDKEFKLQLAVFLFKKGILSSGQAAKMIGVSKRDFIENLGKYGVSVFGETNEDLEKIWNG